MHWSTHPVRHEHVEALGDALEADEHEEGEGDEQQEASDLVLGLAGLVCRLGRLLRAHLAVRLADLGDGNAQVRRSFMKTV